MVMRVVLPAVSVLHAAGEVSLDPSHVLGARSAKSQLSAIGQIAYRFSKTKWRPPHSVDASCQFPNKLEKLSSQPVDENQQSFNRDKMKGGLYSR